MKYGITLDGRLYKVGVVYNSLEQSFQLLQGQNAGKMLAGNKELDLIGTEYSYKLKVEPDPANLADYDDFWEAISAPVDSHTVSLPSNQGTMDFEAVVYSGTRVFDGVIAGWQRWSGLEITFTPIEPQRYVDD